MPALSPSVEGAVAAADHLGEFLHEGSEETSPKRRGVAASARNRALCSSTANIDENDRNRAARASVAVVNPNPAPRRVPGWFFVEVVMPAPILGCMSDRSARHGPRCRGIVGAAHA